MSSCLLVTWETQASSCDGLHAAVLPDAENPGEDILPRPPFALVSRLEQKWKTSLTAKPSLMEIIQKKSYQLASHRSSSPTPLPLPSPHVFTAPVSLCRVFSNAAANTGLNILPILVPWDICCLFARHLRLLQLSVGLDYLFSAFCTSVSIDQQSSRTNSLTPVCARRLPPASHTRDIQTGPLSTSSTTWVPTTSSVCFLNHGLP